MKGTRDSAAGEQSAPLCLHIFDGFRGLHLQCAVITPVFKMFFFTIFIFKKIKVGWLVD